MFASTAVQLEACSKCHQPYVKHELVCVGDEMHSSADHLAKPAAIACSCACHGYMLAVIKVHADSSSSVVVDIYTFWSC